jgi:CHASE2 domain-containing sensor protein
MAEKHVLTTEGETPTYADWPTLIERAMDDVSRIVRSEVHILQAGIGATLEAQVSNAVAHLTIADLIISGAICILCAFILLLHQWLPWWQAFGIAGVVTLVVAFVSNAAMRPPPTLRSKDVNDNPSRV